jgi:hypothetical protein
MLFEHDTTGRTVPVQFIVPNIVNRATSRKQAKERRALHHRNSPAPFSYVKFMADDALRRH